MITLILLSLGTFLTGFNIVLPSSFFNPIPVHEIGECNPDSILYETSGNIGLDTLSFAKIQLPIINSPKKYFVLCSGKVYFYEESKETTLTEKSIKSVAITQIWVKNKNKTILKIEKGKTKYYSNDDFISEDFINVIKDNYLKRMKYTKYKIDPKDNPICLSIPYRLEVGF